MTHIGGIEEHRLPLVRYPMLAVAHTRKQTHKKQNKKEMCAQAQPPESMVNPFAYEGEAVLKKVKGRVKNQGSCPTLLDLL